MSGERLQRTVELVKNSPYKDRIRILTGFNFQNVGPGWADRAVQQLDADLKAGAVGIGEIMLERDRVPFLRHHAARLHEAIRQPDVIELDGAPQ